MATDIARVPAEVTGEIPKEDEDEEESLQTNVIQNNETSTENVSDLSAIENGPEVEINTSVRILNEMTEVTGKVSELQSTVPAATLVSTEEVCETHVNVTAAKVSPSSVSVPAIQKFTRPVPAVSQQRPVIVHPVQQVNSTPRNVRAQMIQPVVTVHSVTSTAAELLQRQRVQARSRFMPTIPQRLPTSQTFQPMPHTRHAQPIGAGSQTQSHFGNIQLVIPAGQLLVPLQSPAVMQANALPILHTYGTHTSQARQNSKPRKSRTIRPKSDEIPSKKQKIDKQEAELQTPSDSLSDNGRELSEVVNTSVIVSTDENKLTAKNETSNLSSDSFSSDYTKKKDKDGSLSEESGETKQDDSSDELMDVDDDFLKYKKLKEERKRKEREEMEMWKKIMEKKKLAKAKKQVALKPESKTQEQREDSGEKPESKTQKQRKDIGDLKSDTAAVSPSGGLKEKVDEETSLHNEINEGIDSLLGKKSNKECPDEDKTVEVIAEWNVPMSGILTETSYKSLKKENSETENQFPLITDLEEIGVTNVVGLDLSVKQQTSRSEQSFSPMMKIWNAGHVNSNIVQPKTDAQEAKSIDMSVSVASQIQNNDLGSIKTPEKQNIIIESENLPSNQGNLIKAAGTSIPVTEDITKSSLNQIAPQIQKNGSGSIKTPEKQDIVIESEILPSDQGNLAKAAGTFIPITKDITKSSSNQVEPQIQYNDSRSIKTPKKQDIMIESDQSCLAKSRETSIPSTKDNTLSSIKQSGSHNATPVSLSSHSVVDTPLSVGYSMNFVQSKNLVTDIELEQRPYSPPLLKPRPISWLERMSEAASTLETDSKHIATTNTTSAYRLAKSPSYIPVEKHPMRRSSSYGSVYSPTSKQSALTITTPVPTKTLKRLYTVSPKPDYYKEFTASPILDNVKKVNRTSGTTATDFIKDLPAKTSDKDMHNVNNMTQRSIEMVDTKDCDPMTVNTLRNPGSCDDLIRTCDLGNNETTEMSGSSKMNRPISNRNIFRDMSRTNEATDKYITNQKCETNDSSVLDQSGVNDVTQENAVPTSLNDTNNERSDTAVEDSRSVATSSDRAVVNVTINSNKIENIGTEMISIKASEVNTTNNEDKLSAVDGDIIAVQRITDGETNSTGVDLTTRHNEKQLDIDMTERQAESLISDKIVDIEDNNAKSDVLQTPLKEMAMTVSSEAENMATETEKMATISVVDFAAYPSSSVAVNVSSSSINAPGEVPAAELLDLSTKRGVNTAIPSPRCSSVPSTPSLVSSTLCTDSSLSVLSRGNDTTCSSSYSTTGVLMSVMMSVGVQEKNMRPRSASSALGADTTELSGNGNSERIPKTKSMVLPKSVSESVSKAPTNEPGILQADGYTTPIDYSMKPLPTIKIEDDDTNCKTLNLMQRSPCSSNSSFHIYTTSSSSSVNISPSGFSTLSKALQDRLNNGKRISHDIPVAHSARPKPDKVPKGAKAQPAHNSCDVTSMKPLIKMMNRTMCQVPVQIKQSCPYFKKTLQYNWSPSPKDTYKSKLARRETPIPPLAHNQKPFGIAGTLITPAGRFIRKRSRSVELKGMPYCPSNAPSHNSGKQQLGSPMLGGHYSSTSYPQMHHHSPNKGPILPPIRAHIHLEGTVDTVTLTNIQKPGAVTQTGLPRLSPRDYSKKCDVVDLTIESREMVQGDSQFIQRDSQLGQRDVSHLDDAEKQIQQELSEAVAKRQKMESGLAGSSIQQKTTVESGGMINNGGNDHDSVDYSQGGEDNVARRRKRARSHSFSFQMNRPVLPTGAYYQPMQPGQGRQGLQKVGPPNVTMNHNYNPTPQEQPRAFLDVETNSLRSVLQATPEDIQAHLRQRQSEPDARVPPLLRLRDAARMSQTISQQLSQPQLQTLPLSQPLSQPQLQTLPLSQPMSQPYNYPVQQETSTAR